MSIVEMSVSGGMMILVTAVLRLAAGDRLPRRGYVALWTAAILRLLIPFKIVSPVSFYGFLSRAATEVKSPGAIAVEKTPAGIPVWAVIWLAGTAITGLAYAAPYVRCIRAFRASTPLENAYLKDWLSTIRLRRRIKVRTLSGLRTPLTYGFLRPVILLPAEAEGWEAERLDLVLCHEFTHIRRFDSALKKLSALALCLHWFDPAVWLMAALLDRDMEFACDSAVVECFGPEHRASYARLLIDLMAPGHSAALVTGFGKSVTEKRVRGVMGYKRTTGTMSLISGILILIVIATFATSYRPEQTIGSPLERAGASKDTASVPDRSPGKPDAHRNSGSHAPDIVNLQACEVSQLSFDELSDVLSRDHADESIFVPTHSEERVAYVVSGISAANQGSAAQ